MKIRVEPECMARIMAVANLTAPYEFSGLAFSRNQGGDILVYDFVPLDVGSYSYTEFPPEEIVRLMQRPDAENLRGWVHRHPMGSGVPGDENWSATDARTILETPLGGVPELVRWSWSMVLTPYGWVGRIDNHIKKVTRHLEVEPSFTALYQAVGVIKAGKAAREMNVIRPEGEYVPVPFEAEDIRRLAGEYLTEAAPEEILDRLAGMTREELLEELLDGLIAYLDEAGDDSGWHQPNLLEMDGEYGPYPS